MGHHRRLTASAASRDPFVPSRRFRWSESNYTIGVLHRLACFLILCKPRKPTAVERTFDARPLQPLWAINSVGWSATLTSSKSQVRVLLRPPAMTLACLVVHADHNSFIPTYSLDRFVT